MPDNDPSMRRNTPNCDIAGGDARGKRVVLHGSRGAPFSNETQPLELSFTLRVRVEFFPPAVLAGAVALRLRYTNAPTKMGSAMTRRREQEEEANRGWLDAAASLLRADIDGRGRSRFMQAPWPEDESRLADLEPRGPISLRRVMFYVGLAGFCVGFWLFVTWLIGG